MSGPDLERMYYFFTENGKVFGFSSVYSSAREKDMRGWEPMSAIRWQDYLGKDKVIELRTTVVWAARDDEPDDDLEPWQIPPEEHEVEEEERPVYYAINFRHIFGFRVIAAEGEKLEQIVP